MEEQNKFENEHREKSKGGRAFLIFLLIVSLLGNGYMVFDYIKDKKKDKELMKLANEVGLNLDSLQKEYDALQMKYQDLMDNSVFISDSLKQVVDSQNLEIVKLYNRIRRSPSPQQLFEAKARLKAFEQKTNRLQQLNDSLITENLAYQQHIATAKSKYEDLSAEVKKVSDKNKDLESKVSKVNFRINDFDAVPINVKRNRREKTYKTGRVDELDISFTVVANDLIEKGKKEISVRIIGTNNEVLGANNDILTESSKLRSMVETFEYDGRSKEFHLTFKQEENWKSGQHTVELSHKGEVIDRIAFILD